MFLDGQLHHISPLPDIEELVGDIHGMEMMGGFCGEKTDGLFL
jgi:hypothetical protein